MSAGEQGSYEVLLMCSKIPPSSPFQDNLSYLWGITALHTIDRYVFLVACPLLFLIQLVTIKFYYQNPLIFGKPGLFYVIIIAFEVVIVLHYFSTGIYFTVLQGQLMMPGSFPAFCETNSILSAFFSMLHFVFVIILPLYIVYMLRTTLKPNAKVWTLGYALVFVVTSVGTYFLWEEGFLGLNIFGLCGVTFIREPETSIVLQIAVITFNIVFVLAGVFAINYYKKHMPNSIGLRAKRHAQQRTLILYVIGYAFFWISESIIEILLYFNCQSSEPSTSFMPLTTLFNLLRVVQCCLIFFILFKEENVRTAFAKFLRRSFWARKQELQSKQTISLSGENQEGNGDEFVLEEVFLRMKQMSNEIDFLKVSQVVTLVSGVYIAYKEYYNMRKDYHSACMVSMIRQNYQHSNQSKVRRKDAFFKQTKKIFFKEKMSIKLTYQLIKDFIVDQSLIPRLGLLECNMTIHAPKIFQLMLQADNLEAIYKSFELHENTRKMFDLAEGQGGRSGQFFFFSNDNKYVLKTITQQQFEFIEENLLFFYEHFSRNPQSVLAKIYGLFTFKGDQIQRTYHLILMKNILGCSNSQIIRTYDMKGSKHDREVNVGDTYGNELSKLTLKDIDFIKEEGFIHVANGHKLKLRQIIMQDTLFLKGLNLLDYSLLVVKVLWKQDPQDPGFWEQYQRIPSSKTEHEYYHIGIIDYLQRWDFQKKGEKWWKKLIGKKDISAQRPSKYQLRYMNFVSEITRLNGMTEESQVEDRSNNSQRNQVPFLNEHLKILEEMEKQLEQDRKNLKLADKNDEQIRSKANKSNLMLPKQVEMSVRSKASLSNASAFSGLGELINQKQ